MSAQIILFINYLIIFIHMSSQLVKLIINNQGGYSITNTPHQPSNNSGVTIGPGIDLKQLSAEDIQKRYGNLVKQNELEFMKKGCQKSGKQAADFVKANKNFKLSKQSYDKLLNFQIKFRIQEVKRIMTKPDLLKKYKDIGYTKDTFEKLPQCIKQILVDMHYNGRFTPKARQIIMKSLCDFVNIEGNGKNQQQLIQQLHKDILKVYQSDPRRMKNIEKYFNDQMKLNKGPEVQNNCRKELNNHQLDNQYLKKLIQRPEQKQIPPGLVFGFGLGAITKLASNLQKKIPTQLINPCVLPKNIQIPCQKPYPQKSNSKDFQNFNKKTIKLMQEKNNQPWRNQIKRYKTTPEFGYAALVKSIKSTVSEKTTAAIDWTKRQVFSQTFKSGLKGSAIATGVVFGIGLTYDLCRGKSLKQAVTQNVKHSTRSFVGSAIGGAVGGVIGSFLPIGTATGSYLGSCIGGIVGGFISRWF